MKVGEWQIDHTYYTCDTKCVKVALAIVAIILVAAGTTLMAQNPINAKFITGAALNGLAIVVSACAFFISPQKNVQEEAPLLDKSSKKVKRDRPVLNKEDQVLKKISLEKFETHIVSKCKDQHAYFRHQHELSQRNPNPYFRLDEQGHLHQVEANNLLCGYYALYFLIQTANGKPLNDRSEFVKLFKEWKKVRWESFAKGIMKKDKFKDKTLYSNGEVDQELLKELAQLQSCFPAVSPEFLNSLLEKEGEVCKKNECLIIDLGRFGSKEELAKVGDLGVTIPIPSNYTGEGCKKPFLVIAQLEDHYYFFRVSRDGEKWDKIDSLNKTPDPGLLDVAKGMLKKSPLFTLSETAKRVKFQQAIQLKKFEAHQKNNEWEYLSGPAAHFDWWMFPIDRSSAGYGHNYELSAIDVDALKKDSDFMRNYRRGVELVAQSWGWDIEKGEKLKNRHPKQTWSNYSVRLAKMVYSLALFDEKKLHANLLKLIRAEHREILEDFASRPDSLFQTRPQYIQ